MEFLGRNLPALVFRDSHKLPPHVHESWDGNCVDFFGISKKFRVPTRLVTTPPEMVKVRRQEGVKEADQPFYKVGVGHCDLSACFISEIGRKLTVL